MRRTAKELRDRIRLTALHRLSRKREVSPARENAFERVRDVWFRTSVIKRKNKTPEFIGGFKQTQGTETSQYLEERTSTETPLVVASERGPGQWRM